jgi:hypothetical protein
MGLFMLMLLIFSYDKLPAWLIIMDITTVLANFSIFIYGNRNYYRRK